MITFLPIQLPVDMPYDKNSQFRLHDGVVLWALLGYYVFGSIVVLLEFLLNLISTSPCYMNDSFW